MAENSAAFLIVFWAVQKRRAILVPINSELKGDFLAHQLRDSLPKVIVADRDVAEVATLGLESLEVVVVTKSAFASASGFRTVSLDELCNEPQAELVLSPTPEDICLILYTSGTSGRSKGVLIPQAHAYLFGLLQSRALALTSDDRFFVALPLFHVNALLMSLGACVLVGAQAYVVSKFSASRWVRQIRDCGATVTNCLGIMAEFVLRQPASDADRNHNLRTVMAVPVSAQWGATFEARFGVRLVQIYGMTECNIVSFSDPDDPLEPGCIGPLASEFFEISIIDPGTDRPVPSGTVGEIAVRPRIASAFMQGYWGLPETTVRAWRNLWFHTGDAGWLDSFSRLHFVDRIGDFIRRRGENISSFEIEAVLATHPAIAECAVVGVRVAGAGGEDEIKAVIVRGDAKPKHAELLEWAVSRLPRYAVPRFWEFVESLDKTQTGKIKKKELRNQGITARVWDREARQKSQDRSVGGALGSQAASAEGSAK
jgi:crotonobetaine/carnitine-CoA ligase